MEMYNSKTKYHCGIDLHKSSAHICVMDKDGNIMLHKNIRDNNFVYMKKVLAPYVDDLTIACESTYNWYPLADFCRSENIEFTLGHALYMKSIHGGKAKNDKIDSKKITDLLRTNLLPHAYACPPEYRAHRDLLRRRIKLVQSKSGISVYMNIFEQQNDLKESTLHMRSNTDKLESIVEYQDFSGIGGIAMERNYQLNTNLLIAYTEELIAVDKDLKEFTLNSAYNEDFEIVKSMPGVGDTLGMVIIYETHDIKRFKSPGKYSSYCRVIKCKKESAGKSYGYSGAKIGNPFLKWAYSQAAVLSKRNPLMKAFSNDLIRQHGERKARAIYTHKICRSIYFMLQRKQKFDPVDFFGRQKYERLQRLNN